jgi:hypothetical protein
MIDVNVSGFTPIPIAAIYAAVIQASIIISPHLFIFASQSGNSVGMIFGISLATSAGLSPMAQKKRHLASYSGGNLDKGWSSTGIYLRRAL